NRSTTVRNAVSAMTKKRNRAPMAVWGSKASSIAPDICDMGQLRSRPLHAVVAGVVQDVERQQRDGLVGQVLPPVGRAGGLARDIAGLVDDGHRAIVAVFDDLALDDVDQRRPVVMAMPGNDAAGLDHEAPQALHMSRRLERRLAEIDRSQDGI